MRSEINDVLKITAGVLLALFIASCVEASLGAVVG